MVQLSFTVIVYANFSKVWKYFSGFSRITEWDPNTIKCEVLKQVSGEVGSEYKIVTVFNQKESDVIYKCVKYTESEKYGYINLWGQNDMITANDEIICRKKGQQQTEVEYRADICLRGFAKLATPFIICSLNKITQQARLGLIKKSIELWGKAV